MLQIYHQHSHHGRANNLKKKIITRNILNNVKLYKNKLPPRLYFEQDTLMVLLNFFPRKVAIDCLICDSITKKRCNSLGFSELEIR